ncbi:hypothetical protein ACFWHT_09405 [Microbacterium sp. NPDC058342]|uniref:hypothetical protein n=1 Tax=Microbacterium sp. NPDC058342 TaxID=3346454 RepID=UPI0036473111
MSTGQESIRPHDAPEDASATDAPIDDAVYFEEQVEPEYGILGFTLRELAIVAAWAVIFIVSFFPVVLDAGSVWTRGIDWILTVGVPTVAVFLVVLRRLSPDGIRRVGSLGIDQFASVAAAVAALAWAQLLWRQISASIDTGVFLVGWVTVVAQLGALALVAATVAAPLIPRLREDFLGRMETLAHRSANPVRPVIVRPRPDAPASAPAEDEDGAREQDDAQPAAAGDPDAARTDVAQPGVDTSLTLVIDDHPTEEASDDQTRVIETIPAPQRGSGSGSEAPVHDADPPLEEAPAETADAHGGAWARDTGTAYTDPIGALDEIFAATPATSHEPPPADETTAAADDATTVGRDLPDDGDAPLRRHRSAEPTPSGAEPQQPFWVLAQTERDVLDEHGHPLFRIGPTAWTLVIEDREGAYVVRHDDGRIGYLHDITDITKG